MSENLMNSAHKSSTPQSRKGYEAIRWDHVKSPEEMKMDAIRRRWGNFFNGVEVDKYAPSGSINFTGV